MQEEKKPIHFNEMLHILSVAEEHRQLLDICAWKSDGEKVLYKKWLVHHDHWRGGYVILRNPRNNEMRTVPEIYIFAINGKKVYL